MKKRKIITYQHLTKFPEIEFGLGYRATVPKDVNNYSVSETMVKKAMKEGSGWTDYPYMNISTGKISMKYTYAKLFRHAGKDYIICCGVWYNLPPVSPGFVARAELVEYRYQISSPCSHVSCSVWAITRETTERRQSQK